MSREKKKRKHPRKEQSKGLENITLSKKERERIDRIKAKIGDEPAELLSYEITTEPIEDRAYKRLPPRVKDQLETLHDMALSQPKKAVSEIKALIQKYPRIPVLYNYLSVAYSVIGNFKKRDAVILECCEKFPDYLFGRVNYAQICLERGEVEKVPEIFDNKLDLKLLYPQRTKFHISEYVNFAGIIGVYYAQIGELDAAKLYYDSLKQIAPWDRMTRMLKRAIYPPLRVRFIKWLYKKLTGHEITQAQVKRRRAE